MSNVEISLYTLKPAAICANYQLTFYIYCTEIRLSFCYNMNERSNLTLRVQVSEKRDGGDKL